VDTRLEQEMKYTQCLTKVDDETLEKIKDILYTQSATMNISLLDMFVSLNRCLCEFKLPIIFEDIQCLNTREI
jgi:hypothetical protein